MINTNMEKLTAGRRHRNCIKGIASLCMGIALILCAALALTGCGGQTGGAGAASDTEPVSRDFFAMDTYMTVTAYGDQAAEAAKEAEAEVGRLDAMLSTGSASSEISRINRAGGGVLSAEAGALVERGLTLYEETGHRFDIAIYPVMEAWGFPDKKYRVPGKDELRELLELTDAGKVACEESTDGETGVRVTFGKKGMAIDLGGIAKGYTSSRIMDIYRDHGITSGLVSLGGNVQVLGTKPDGSKWRVAVQDPGSKQADAEDHAKAGSAADDRSGEEAASDKASEAAASPEYLGILEASDVAVITSGAYERNFTMNGHFYHHIIDPATGRPADSGLRSVTIVSEDGTLADALSTSLYIMGKEQAIDYWRVHADQFNCILLDEDNQLWVTKPIADSFHSDDYTVKVAE